MYIGITLIVCSLIYTILITAVYFSKKRPENLENKIYNLLIIANFICLLLELSCCFLVPNIAKYPMLNFLGNRFFLISILIWLTLFTRYIFIISFNNDSKLAIKVKQNYKIILSVTLTFCAICIILFMILPLNYYFDGTYVYSYGISTNFLYGITAFYTVFLLTCVGLNIKYVSTFRIYCMCSYSVNR